MRKRQHSLKLFSLGMLLSCTFVKTSKKIHLFLFVLLTVLSVPSAFGQISTLNVWSNLYHGTLTTAQSIPYTVPTGSNARRVLVIGIASSRTTVGSRTVTLTYGGQTLSSVAGDMATTTVQQHTQLYYLNEAGLDAATSTTLSVTVGNGTTRVTDVFAAAFDNVDQGATITNSQTYSSGTGTTGAPVFATALTVNASDQAVEIISSMRTGNTTARNITAAANWTLAAQQTWATTDGVRNATANRSISATNTTDASSTTFSGSTLASMTALSFGYAHKYFRSLTSGNWNSTTTWQESYDNSIWTAATSVPSSIDNIAIIQSGHTVTLTAAATASSLTVNGVLDLGAFTLTGTGTMNMSSTGSLLVGGTSNFPTGFTSTILSTGSTVNYDNAGAQTVTAITYSNLILSGNNTKTLTGVSAINGNLTLSGAASATAAAGMTIGGDVTIGSGTTFSGSTFTHNVAGNWINGGTYTASTSTVTFNGANQQNIGGTNSTAFNNLIINKTGSSPNNTLTLGIATSVAGTLTVSNGILDLSTFNVTNVGAVSLTGSTIQGSGTMTLGGNVTTIASANSATISAPLALGVATRTFTVAAGAATDDLSITSVVSGSGGLTKAGAGVLNLSGASTYSGTTTISAGTIKLGAAGSGANSPLGTTSSGTTVSNGATLDLNGFTLVTAEPLTLNGTGISSGGALMNSSVTTVSYSGLVTLGSTGVSIEANAGDINLTNTGTISGATFGLTLGGSGNGSLSSIIGTTSGTLTKNDAGLWTLSGASTYTGSTSINGGTLKLGAAGSGANSPLGTTGGGTIVANGATLDLNGFTLATAEPLTLNGTGISSGGALMNSSVTTVSYSGLITLGSTGVSIEANAGDINITNSGTISGATFGLTLGGAGNGTISSIIGTTSGTLTKTDAGIWTLSGASTYTGLTSINGGTLKLGSAGSGANTPLGTTGGGTTVANGATLDLNGFTLATAEPLTLNGTGISSGGALMNSSSTAVSYSGLITLGSTGVSIEANAGDINITNASTIAGAGFGLTLGGTGNGSLSSIIGTTSGTLTKNDAGIWTLSGASTYTGLTTISAGTLKLGATGSGANSPLGTTASGTTVASGASLDLNGYTLATAEPLTLNGSGGDGLGALRNTGGADTYAGLVTLGSSSKIAGIGGTIAITNAGVITGSGFDLTLGGASGGSVNSVIGTGGGRIIKTDAGLWILSGTNTYTGATTITAGELRLNPAANITPATQFIMNGGTLSTTGITAARTITSSSTLNLNNSSSLALGANGHTLSFAASNGVSWSAGTLTISGWTGGYDGTTGTAGKIFAGSNSNGLTLGQLNQVQFFDGSTNFAATILSNGEVVPCVRTITTQTITGSPFCAGSTGVSIPFTYNPKANFANATFTAQLSNAAGSFTSPVILQNVVSNGSGSQSLNVTIPPATPAGTGYRIRIVSTNPAITGSDNGTDITVSGAVPAQPGSITGSAAPCANTTGVTYSVPNVSGVVYTWALPVGWTQTGGGTTNSITVSTGSSSGNIQVTPSNACGVGTAQTLAVAVVAGPAITVQPSTNPQSLCQNGTTTAFSVTASGTGLSYQWYKNTTSSNSGGTSISGAASSSYTPLSSTTGTSYYYCVVSGTCAPVATSDVSGAVTIIVPQALIGAPASRCGTGTVNLSVTSSTCFSPSPTINWFAAATGGTSLGTGTSFTTPSISTTTTYYAQETFTGGLATSTANPVATNAYGLTFDLSEPIVLNSVQIYASGTASSITIGLQDNTGAAVTGITPYTFTPSVGTQTVPLNWTIPSGSGYRIVKTTGTMNLSSATSSLSWPVGFEVGSITSSIESGVVNTSRYDYFYNWSISRVRVPVTAIVGAPTVTGFSGSMCGPGVVTLGASATGGIISWFTALTGGSAIATGTTYSPNLSTTTTYYVQSTDGACTSSPRIPVVASIITKPTITAGGAGTFCTGSTINLTSSGTGLTNRYWTGPNGFYSLLNNPVLTGATSAMTGTYTVIGSALSGVNLVTNGDFEAGNTGFGSSYIFSSDLQPEGRYAVVADPHSVHSGFTTCADHNSTGTLQLVINGATVANVNVWSQTVNVVPNTDYQYTYWIQSVVASNPAQLQLYINGSPAGPVYTADTPTCSWKQFTYNWNSGSSTSAYLSLVNQNTIAGGNDFAIDDIVFQPACTTESSIPVVPDPNGPGNEYAAFGVIYVTVSEDPTAGTIGTTQSICSGSTPSTLTSLAAGTGSGTITYEWQANTGSGYTTIAGATSSTYSPPSLTVTTSYQRRTVTNNKGVICISPYTTPVTVTVNSAATATAGGPNSGICQSASPSPIILSGASVGGSATTGAWSIVSGGGSLSDYSQTASPATVTYTPAANFSGTVTLRLTTNNVGCTAIADRAIVIDPTTAINSQSTVAQTQCINGTFTPITVTVTGAGLSYQWYSSTNGTINGGISLGSANGAQTNSYTPQAGTAGTLYYFCIVNGNCGSAVTSAISGAFIVTPLPAATISYAGSPYCSNLGIVFITRTGTQGGTYSAAPAGLSINTGTGAITTTSSTPGTYTVTYTVAAAGGCGIFTTICSVTIKLDGVWNGSSGTDWNTTANWDCNQLPTLSSNVIIATALPNYPTLSSGSPGMSRNLAIQNNSSVTISGNVLQIAGTITNSGTLNATGGTIEMKGSSAQTIPSGVFATNTILNLTINNTSGVTLAGPLNVSGIVKALNGNLSSGGNLTLVSTATQTALIDGTGSGDVTGIVTMQRYLASRFGYKYFSTPFSDATVGQFSPPVDLSTLIFPTFYRYDENMATSGWVKYIDPASPLSPIQGYAVNFGTNSAPLTLSLSGTVNNGTLGPITLANNDQTYTQGFNLIGNPYPSPIDWNASTGWTKTNIDDAVYYFNASNPGSNNDSLRYTGTYSSYIRGNSSDGIANNIIPAMQGFFVHVSTLHSVADATVIFNNGIRINHLNPVFKSADLNSEPLLRLSAGFEGNGAPADPAVIYFDDSATLSFDSDRDALKIMNSDDRVPNLYVISKDSKKLSINGMPTPTDSLTRIPLGLKIAANGTIIFRARDMVNIPSGIHIYLEDAANHTCQDLKLYPEYSTLLKSGVYENRFSIIFSFSGLTNPPPIAYVEKFTLIPKGGIWVVNLNQTENTRGILQLVNMLGQVLYRKEVFGNESVELNISQNTGVFIISLISENKIYSKKILIPKR